MQDAIAAGVNHRISAMERRLHDSLTAAVAPVTRTTQDLARKNDELDHRTTQLAKTVNQLPGQIDHAVAAAVTAALRPLTARLDATDNTSATTAQAITQAVAAAMRPFVNRLDDWPRHRRRRARYRQPPRTRLRLAPPSPPTERPRRRRV
jgi:hypothetical protein